MLKKEYTILWPQKLYGTTLSPMKRGSTDVKEQKTETNTDQLGLFLSLLCSFLCLLLHFLQTFLWLGLLVLPRCPKTGRETKTNILVSFHLLYFVLPMGHCNCLGIFILHHCQLQIWSLGYFGSIALWKQVPCGLCDHLESRKQDMQGVSICQLSHKHTGTSQ